jgi:multidrug resistance efflux pump
LDPSSLAGTVAALQAEIHQLRADLEQARAERNRMLDTQQRLVELLGSKSADRIVHDVRNVMNERELFKALADTAG